MPVFDKDNHLVDMVTEKDLVTKEKGLNILSYMKFIVSILSIDGKRLANVSKKRIEALTAQDVISATNICRTFRSYYRRNRLAYDE